MAEAINLTLLKRLAPIIEKKVREELSLLINSTDEANQLASSFKKIQNVLMDAEQVKVTDPEVRSFLDKLQDIAYDIDDALDEWDWNNIRVQMADTFESSSSSDNPCWEKVSCFLQSVCLCFRNVVERRSVNLNIKQLNERLHGLPEENKKEFNFLPNLSADNSQDIKRTETTSFVNVSEVYGRDDDKKFLVSELLYEGSSSSSSQTKNDIPVFSIVGGGGMGKTTLAQLVCNDKRIEDHFDVKLWVCVSDPFDEIKIAKDILENLNKEASNLSQFNALLHRIKCDIFRKKFLLVLDDVWTEDGTKWKSFREALKSGAPDSRILVTTRKTTVALAMGSNQRHTRLLNKISDLDSWRMLSEIAFQHGREEFERKILKDIAGWKIAQKCKGLPLAIKVIGSLLQSKSREEEWRSVLESPWWKWDEVQRDIFAPLALSYDELHPVAKRCFSYCAIFPKGTSLDPDILIRMWCAQGFLSSIASNDDMEQKGRKIFDDLAIHSLFQDPKFEGNHIFRCKMHDIVHDFAQFVSKTECLIVENVDGGATSADIRSARHLNFLVGADKYMVDINSNEKCRSFLITPGKNIPLDLFRHLKRVRVLILNGFFSEIIPSEIGSLIHLRYLDLSWNYGIKELPEAICDLYNLETLILNLCYILSSFPPGIHKLKKLRHIFNEDTFMEFPEGIEKLTNLRTLNEIHASSRTNWKGLEYLENMNKLGGSLKISIEGGDADKHQLLLEAADQAKLENKTFIQQLGLVYEGNVPNDVLEALKPHPQLEFLHFEGPYLPQWLTTLTYLREVSILIRGGVLAHHLPVLRNLAPSLNYLKLEGIDGMNIPNFKELYAFPKLKQLHFTRCGEWEEWEDMSEEEENNNINLSIFPSLEHLSFDWCRNLKALPHRLLRRSPCLKRLDVWSGCEKLKERYQDWERFSQIHGISHITPTIW